MLRKIASDGVLLGRTCFFCNRRPTYRLSDKRVKCRNCGAVYSLNKLKRDLSVLYFFYIELSARKAAKELGISYNSVTRRYMQFRKEIAKYSDYEMRKLKGEIEIDESYFGGKRKGKRGRGAYNKAIVFGILERNGKVSITVVTDTTAKTLMDEISEKTEKGSVFFTDCFKSYKSLKQFGKHMKVNHQKTFGKGHNHINGSEHVQNIAGAKATAHILKASGLMQRRGS